MKYNHKTSPALLVAGVVEVGECAKSAEFKEKSVYLSLGVFCDTQVHLPSKGIASATAIAGCADNILSAISFLPKIPKHNVSMP